MPPEPRQAVIQYPGAIRARLRWGNSNQAADVFALSEVGGALTDLGSPGLGRPGRPVPGRAPRRRPGGAAWTVRLASPIYDEPAGILWDTEGLLVVAYGFTDLRVRGADRRAPLVAPLGHAVARRLRVVARRATSSCSRSSRRSRSRARARSRGGGRTRTSSSARNWWAAGWCSTSFDGPAGRARPGDRSVRRPEPRPSAGSPCGAVVDNGTFGTRSSSTSPIDRPPRAPTSLTSDPEGPGRHCRR